MYMWKNSGGEYTNTGIYYGYAFYVVTVMMMMMTGTVILFIRYRGDLATLQNIHSWSLRQFSRTQDRQYTHSNKICDFCPVMLGDVDLIACCWRPPIFPSPCSAHNVMFTKPHIHSCFSRSLSLSLSLPNYIPRITRRKKDSKIPSSWSIAVYEGCI